MAEAYPLQWPHGWPRTASSKQKASKFVSTYDRACRKLRDVVRMLGGKNLVVSSESPIAKTGVPYADYARRRIDDPSVAVYFTLKDQQCVMARDAHWTVHENIMRIAHAIEHMRGLSRHGGDHMMTQAFAGFAALPAPANMKPSRPWFEVLGLPAGCDDKDLIEAAFKVKAANAHDELVKALKECAGATYVMDLCVATGKARALLMCIGTATVDPPDNGTTVVHMARYEPCPVEQTAKFAPPPKYPTQAQCLANPKLNCG